MFLHTISLLYLVDRRVWLVCFSKALAASGMHWTSAERTAPLNAPSLTESTKQSVKEEEEGELGGGV